MPGIKTITIVVPALLAAAGTYAAPFQTRGMDNIIHQCNHNFAYASSLSPVGPFYWCRAPTTETNWILHDRYTFDDGPYDWNTDLVNKFDSVGGKTTFCSFHIPIREK